MRNPIIRTAIVVTGIVLATYLAACGYLFVFQRDYVFKPSGTLAPPVDKNLPGVEVVTLKTADGTRLMGWFQPAKAGEATVLYFHGNAGNVSERAGRFKQILDSGLGFLAMSYRGYAGSEGSPSELALVSDGLEIFDWLAKRSDKIVVYGESLGTGVAIEVAAKRTGRTLVLEAPFTAALDIAAATYPWVPVGFLMGDSFLSREHIKSVDEPILVVHGTADQVIPVEQGKRLFEIAREPKSLAIIDGAAHDDLWDRGLWPIVMEFLRGQGVLIGPQARLECQPVVRRMPSFAAA